MAKETKKSTPKDYDRWGNVGVVFTDKPNKKVVKKVVKKVKKGK